MKNKALVIGSPINHSLSPLIYNTLYKIYNIPGKYTAKEVTDKTLAEFIEYAKTNLDGFNVTMPLKNSIKKHLDYNYAYGSVNTVKISKNKLLGYSTDETGFMQSINKYRFKEKNILILGGGNVACSLYNVLKPLCSSVKLSLRDPSKVTSLYNKCVFLEKESLNTANMIINATPLGIAGKNDFKEYSFLNHIKKDCFIYDLNYSPTMSPLESKAVMLGLKAKNGLDMLIYQALTSFEIIYGIKTNEHDFAKIKDLIIK